MKYAEAQARIVARDHGALSALTGEAVVDGRLVRWFASWHRGNGSDLHGDAFVDTDVVSYPPARSHPVWPALRAWQDEGADWPTARSMGWVPYFRWPGVLP